MRNFPLWEIVLCLLWFAIVSDCAAHMKFIKGRKKLLLSGCFVNYSVKRAKSCSSTFNFTFNFVYTVTESDFNFSDLKHKITCRPRISPSLPFQFYTFQNKWKTNVSLFVQYYLIMYLRLWSHMHTNRLGCILCYKNDYQRMKTCL